MPRPSVSCLTVFFGFLFVSAQTVEASPPPKKVRVVNTPDVSVVNTPSVNVANEPTVNVGNTPLPVTIENGGSSSAVEYRFVGFSAETRLGNAGYKGMHEACQNTFTLESRMCFTDEVMASPEITSVSGAPPDGAWVNPRFVGVNTVFGNYSAGEPRFLDVSGTWGTNLNCSGWSKSGGAGLALIGDNILIGTLPCINSTPRRVACCAPQ